jgi:hypothetical protein
VAVLLFKTNFQGGKPTDINVADFYKSKEQGPRLKQNVEYRSDGSGTLQYYARLHTKQLTAPYTVLCDKKSINATGKITLPTGTWTAASTMVQGHNIHDGCWISDVRVGGALSNAGKMVLLLWGTVGNWPTYGELDVYERFVTTPASNTSINMHYGPRGASTQDHVVVDLTAAGITGGPTAWHTVKTTLNGNSLKVWMDGVLVYDNMAAGRDGLKVIPPTTGGNKLYYKMQTAIAGHGAGGESWTDWTNVEVYDADPGPTYRMQAPGLGTGGDTTPPTPNPLVIGTPTVSGTSATISWGSATDAGSGMKEYRVLRSVTSATGGFTQIATVPATNVTGTRQTVLGLFDGINSDMVTEEGSTPNGLGRGLLGRRVYRNWPSKATPLNDNASGVFHAGSDEENWHQAGHMVAISMTKSNKAGNPGYSAIQIANAKTVAGQQGGTHIYDELVSMFTRMYNQPFGGTAAPYIIFIYEHEMNSGLAGTPTPTAADFIAAWKMLWNTSRTVATSLGKDPRLIRFAIVPTHAMWTGGHVTTWWPGDQYVDICGTDLYNSVGIFGGAKDSAGNRVGDWSQWKQFQTMYENGGSTSLPTWASNHGGKEVGVFETNTVNIEGPYDGGSMTAMNGTKPSDPNLTKTWWINMGNYVANHPEIAYIYAFNQGALWDYSNANHPLSHQGFASAATAMGGNAHTYVGVIGSGSSVTFTDSGLAPSTNYWYRVVAADKASPANLTNAQASGTLVSTGTNSNPKPNPPTNLVATWDTANGGVLISWNASTTTTVDTYNVYRDGVLLGSVTDTTQYLDTSAAGDTDYNYTVTSYDSGFDTESTQPLPIPFHTPVLNQPPSAPPFVSATPLSATQVQLNWAPATDADSPIAHYTVYYATSGSVLGFYADVPGGSGTNSYTVSGLTANTAYDFGVTAWDTYPAEGPAATTSATTLTSGSLPVPSLLLSTLAANIGDIIFADIGGTTGNPNDISIDWGDGTAPYTATTLPAASISHQYTVAGTYTVLASFSNVTGGPTTIQQVVTIGEPSHPPVNFTRIPAKFNIRAQFRNVINTVTDQMKSYVNDLYDRIDAVKTEPHAIAVDDENTVAFGVRTTDDQYNRLQITGAGDVYVGDGDTDPLASNPGTTNAAIDLVFADSTNSGTSTTGSTAPTFTWPDGVDAGVMVVVRITVKASSPTVTTPSGWTLQGTISNSNGNDTMNVYTLSSPTTGTETGTVTFTLGSAAMWELDYAGFSNVASIETGGALAFATNPNTAQTAHNIPSITTVNTNTMQVGVVGARGSTPSGPSFSLSSAATAAGVNIAATGRTTSSQNNVGGAIVYWKATDPDTYVGYTLQTASGAFSEAGHLTLVPNVLTASEVTFPVHLWDQSTTAQATLAMDDDGRAGVEIIGHQNAVKPLQRWADFLGNDIAQVMPFGGLWVNDNLSTYYGSAVAGYGPPYFQADIYGFRYNGTRAEFSFGGQPGNMLTWDDAVHEQYQRSRLISVANWSAAFGTCTVAAREISQFTTPTGYRGSLRVTSTGSSNSVFAYAGGAFGVPVVAGQQYSFIVNLKAVTVGATRQAQVYIGWSNSSGTFISNSSASTLTNLSTSAWTTYAVQVTAPAGAAFAQPVVSIATAAVGEVVDVCGAALYKGSHTKFAPPFVGSPAGIGLDGGARLGDTWFRQDTGAIWMCTTAGYPYQQVWTQVSGASATIPAGVPLGIITHNSVGSDSAVTSGSTELVSTTFDTSFTAVLGRKYKVSFRAPFEGSVASDTFTIRTRYTTDGSAPSASSTNGGNHVNVVPAGNNRSHVNYVALLDSATLSGTIRISPAMIRGSGTGTLRIVGSTAYAYECWIEDIGGI